MPRLILMRHAKSDWDDPSLSDHDRPLNSRGRKAARALGRWLREQRLVPDAALVSTATRTRETWAGLTAEWGDEAPEAQVLAELYAATPEAMLALLRGMTQETVLLLGHNPGVADLAATLVAEAPEHPKFHRYPTGATLIAEVGSDGWAGLQPAGARAAAFVVPRDLG